MKNHAPRHHCHGQSICSTYPGSQPPGRERSPLVFRAPTRLPIIGWTHLRLVRQRYNAGILHQHRFSMFARKLISLCFFRLENWFPHRPRILYDSTNGTSIKIELMFALSAKRMFKRYEWPRKDTNGIHRVHKPCQVMD